VAVPSAFGDINAIPPSTAGEGLNPGQRDLQGTNMGNHRERDKQATHCSMRVSPLCHPNHTPADVWLASSQQPGPAKLLSARYSSCCGVGQAWSTADDPARQEKPVPGPLPTRVRRYMYTRIQPRDLPTRRLSRFLEPENLIAWLLESGNVIVPELSARGR